MNFFEPITQGPQEPLIMILFLVGGAIVLSLLFVMMRRDQHDRPRFWFMFMWSLPVIYIVTAIVGTILGL